MPRTVSFIRSLPRAERKYKHFYDKRTLGFYERLAKSPLSSPFLENRLLNVDSSATSGENQEVERNTRLLLVFLPTLLSCVSRFLRAL